MLGDLNATHKQWFCRTDSKSGLILDNFLQKHRLHILNNEHPTFVYSNNILDLAIATDIIVSQIDNFKTNDEIDSNHYAISFHVKKQKNNSIYDRNKQSKGTHTRKLQYR